MSLLERLCWVVGACVAWAFLIYIMVMPEDQARAEWESAWCIRLGLLLMAGGLAWLFREIREEKR